MKDINQLMEIQSCKVTPYRPVGNSQVERVHGTINRLMAKLIANNQTNWSDCIPYVTYAYNTSHHSSTLFTPFYLMFLREPRVSLDFVGEPMFTNPFETTEEYVSQIKQRMRDAYELVFEQLQVVFDRAKRRYDPRVKLCRFFCESAGLVLLPAQSEESFSQVEPYFVGTKLVPTKYFGKLMTSTTLFVSHQNMRLSRFTSIVNVNISPLWK